MEPDSAARRLPRMEATVALVGCGDLLRAGAVVTASAAPTFDAFYAEHHAPIARALGLTLGDLELGVEATDEAMTRAYQRWRTVGGYANPQGWVYRVGLNWARSFLRRRRRMTMRADLEETATLDPEPPDADLLRALAALDDKHRSVVVLRYYLDWSVEQTADALRVAPGTVKSRLHRALSRLEAELTTRPPRTADPSLSTEERR